MTAATRVAEIFRMKFSETSSGSAISGWKRTPAVVGGDFQPENLLPQRGESSTRL